MNVCEWVNVTCYIRHYIRTSPVIIFENVGKTVHELNQSHTCSGALMTPVL